MMDVDSTSVPPRLPGRVIANNESATALSLTAANRTSFLTGKILRGADVVEPRSHGDEDATSFRHNRPVNALVGRDDGSDGVQDAVISVDAGKERESALHDQTRTRQLQIPSSNSNSQDTSTTNDTTDQIFSPPASAGGLSRTNSQGNGQDSSQESQLLQLSQIAATREKMLNPGEASDGSSDQNGGRSRKRTADGMVKNTAEFSPTSAMLKGGHSRNTSTVSVASSAGSRVGELSAELKTRLSYAMVKVNNGWQSHTIDQVETLVSQAASPTSSNSTIHFRQGTSASPQLSTSSHRGSNNTTPATGVQHRATPRLNESTNHTLRDSSRNHAQSNASSSVASSKQTPSLAPPVSIQPSQYLGNPRRNSNPRHTPSLATHSHLASPNTTPHTPGQPSPYPNSPHQRTPVLDPVLYSPRQTPQQDVREQDAMEALLFMSSPGNSANLKHNFPSSSQPLSSSRNSLQRTTLPGSQPRKSLPSGRPPQHPGSHPYSQSQSKRVGFERSPGTSGPVDEDDPTASPYSRGTPRRKVNGPDSRGNEPRNATASRLKQLPLSSGLSPPSRPHRRLADEDIDRMLDSVAAEDSSDSDGEIVIPVRTQRREGAPAAVQ